MDTQTLSVYPEGVIQTYSGKFVDPFDFKPEDFDVKDVAHALSLTCRWGGMCRTFFSVAQHSLLCSIYCDDPRWGLMHDASEAYLADLASPVKPRVRGFKEAELGIQQAIAEVLNLTWPMPECVGVTDRRLLVTEQRELMPPGPSFIPDVEPFAWSFTPSTPGMAERNFLNRYMELFNE